MTSPHPIYLDNHSTTQVDPRVVDAMLPYFTDAYGNASSTQHQFGWKAEAAVLHSRRQIAGLIGADAREIIFTGGATESINLALKGIAEGYSSRGDHIVTTRAEHSATLDSCRELERAGFAVSYLRVDRDGNIDLKELDDSITGKTVLVSVLLANNEIGTLAPLADIGALCRSRGVLLHADATQAPGHVRLNLTEWNVDLASFSAHKMHGPKGVGALYVRSRSPRILLTPQMVGGGQELGLRSGTVNVPGIVGFGKAAEIAAGEIDLMPHRIASLRDRFEAGIAEKLDGITINGNKKSRLPNNSNITFHGVSAARLIMDMKEIAVSTGSACSSASPEPSHVLLATGLNRTDALSTLRFGLSKFTTEEEIDYTINRVVHAVTDVREKTLHLVHS
jgi:cysteine desulfurase